MIEVGSGYEVMWTCGMVIYVNTTCDSWGKGYGTLCTDNSLIVSLNKS
jgi:hypothetical protein